MTETSMKKVKPSNLNKDNHNKSSDDSVDVECHNYQQGFIDGGNASTNQGIEIAIETERERCVEIVLNHLEETGHWTDKARNDYTKDIAKAIKDTK